MGLEGMLRMDEVNKIKKAYRDGESINEIAERFNRSWATVKKVLDTPVDKMVSRGRRSSRVRTVVTTEVEDAIEAFLDREDMLRVKKKQRYTAAILFKELTNSGVYNGSRRQLQDVVKRLRENRGQMKPRSYLPLEFPIGTTAQFDHGECDLMIDNRRVLGYLFICSIPGAVLRYCQVFPVKSREAWGEFHERSYRFFGGVLPVSIYDNDSVLVQEIMGTERVQTQFSLALEEHYQMRSRFCNPASGNEKGSVENGVGYCRRNYLPGCPSFTSWKEVNQKLEEDCRHFILSEVHYKNGRQLISIFNEMTEQLHPLFISRAWCRSIEVRVDSFQLVHADSYCYSVPERFVGACVRVDVGVFNVEIFSYNTRIAQHTRRFGETSCSFFLDHYLDQLLRKPGALWDCQAVRQHNFYPELLSVWERLQTKYPEREANRKFIEVLHLGRRYGSKELVAASREAVSLGSVEPTVIENIILSFVSAPSMTTTTQSYEQHIPDGQFDTWSCDVEQYSQLAGGL